MHTDEETVIHNIHFFQEFGIPFELFRQERPLLWPQLQSFASVDPVEVLKCDLVLFFGSFVLRVESPNSTALEVVCLVDVFVRWEQVVHDDEVDLPPSR